eukprot:2764171-Amphidinium_carterae.5
MQHWQRHLITQHLKHFGITQAQITQLGAETHQVLQLLRKQDIEDVIHTSLTAVQWRKWLLLVADLDAIINHGDETDAPEKGSSPESPTHTVRTHMSMVSSMTPSTVDSTRHTGNLS